ncbi:PAS domain-containing protein [Halobaculum gomorrense]|uniref:PAS domain S-box-containing protein n=1 Tax=Halobaculum gomorrense TaxID=43928 RepID=A0A1M5NP85_9EURY|nr:PAS domain-containing protein [Halobaculum gomorrense]SHG91394.1 PAS domain S-box-containing protein [Halobaculum gomorrense]
MTSRNLLADLIRLDHDRFRARVPDALAAAEYDGDRLDRLGDSVDADDIASAASGPAVSLTDREAAYVERIRVLDDASVGITFTGPAYADNPVLYATRRARVLTGYGLTELQGRNLRLLQGPDTERGPVADLREALSTWTRTTVELRNYRADGTPFDNRVTIVPIADRSGSVVNWLGFQAAVDE